MGVMTQEVATTGLTPLIEKLNLAAAAGDQQLRVALINLEPELQDIGRPCAMRNSGMDTRFLTEMIDQLQVRAGSLPGVAEGQHRQRRAGEGDTTLHAKDEPSSSLQYPTVLGQEEPVMKLIPGIVILVVLMAAAGVISSISSGSHAVRPVKAPAAPAPPSPAPEPMTQRPTPPPAAEVASRTEPPLTEDDVNQLLFQCAGYPEHQVRIARLDRQRVAYERRRRYDDAQLIANAMRMRASRCH